MRNWKRCTCTCQAPWLRQNISLHVPVPYDWSPMEENCYVPCVQRRSRPGPSSHAPESYTNRTWHGHCWFHSSGTVTGPSVLMANHVLCASDGEAPVAEDTGKSICPPGLFTLLFQRAIAMSRDTAHLHCNVVEVTFTPTITTGTGKGHLTELT
jgi:hypothetical protein